ncbi:MAG: hypothetical protein D6766_11080 [Verrucomicrobia bacterium]|nr:MAG: hypothetical protein D6766_11080 [Verrucomicrobiota bacterium]
MKTLFQRFGDGKAGRFPRRVAIVGGGPAGAFLALHLRREAAEAGRDLEVVVYEPAWQVAGEEAGGGWCWKGCNHCAGGLSPLLCAELRRLGLELPERLVQDRIRRVTIQGYWKNIEIDVPPGREMVSVFRGGYPVKRRHRDESFDSWLLGEAARAGARVVAARVMWIHRRADGGWRLELSGPGGGGMAEADFVALATGVNKGCGGLEGLGLAAIREALPGFRPPRRRKALVFEVELDTPLPGELAGVLHFVEYGSRELRLEMCSVVPKRRFATVVLVGPAVDAARTGADNRAILDRFLALPHVRKLLPPQQKVRAACLCTPWMVTGVARRFVADGAAAVGDLATTRLNKDGILSACVMARALAQTLVRRGGDEASLRRGYVPAVRAFQRDNWCAALVFLTHRLVFSNSVLSRVLYQAVIYERKTRPSSERQLEQALWEVASGEQPYARVLRRMLHPRVVISVLHGGFYITLRNTLTEKAFGLKWEGFGRFPTGVAWERLHVKRAEFARWLAMAGTRVPPEGLEFERMYTIRIPAPRGVILRQIGRFGEPDRRFLRPRGVVVRRLAGEPCREGCLIQYRVFHRRFCFHLLLERVLEDRLAVYRVLDGFARQGILVFEVEEAGPGVCDLSIYVAFNFPRGRGVFSRIFWRAFRRLFPAFVHDVLWNHSLCQFKDALLDDLRRAGGARGDVGSREERVDPASRPAA